MPAGIEKGMIVRTQHILNLWSPGSRPPQRSCHWLAVLAAVCAGLVSSLATDVALLPPLTTVSGSPRLPGKFVWADLVTDDVPAARTFYGRLFGWTFRDVGKYTIAANDERPLCRDVPATAARGPAAGQAALVRLPLGRQR